MVTWGRTARALVAALAGAALLPLSPVRADPPCPVAAPIPPQVPGAQQRPGDKEKGYKALISKGRVGCGVPSTYYDLVAALLPTSLQPDTLPGRPPGDEGLPYFLNRFQTKDGIDVLAPNCLLCHAGRINGKLVVGLGNADGWYQVFGPEAPRIASWIQSGSWLYFWSPTRRAEMKRVGDRVREDVMVAPGRCARSTASTTHCTARCRCRLHSASCWGAASPSCASRACRCSPPARCSAASSTSTWRAKSSAPRKTSCSTPCANWFGVSWADIVLAQWEREPTSADAARAALRACAELRGFARIFRMARPAAARCTAHADWLRGRRARALRGWRKSIQRARDLTMPYDEARSLAALAHAADGADERAACAADSQRLFRQLGCRQPPEVGLRR